MQILPRLLVMGNCFILHAGYLLLCPSLVPKLSSYLTSMLTEAFEALLHCTANHSSIQHTEGLFCGITALAWCYFLFLLSKQLLENMLSVSLWRQENWVSPVQEKTVLFFFFYFIILQNISKNLYFCGNLEMSQHPQAMQRNTYQCCTGQPRFMLLVRL